MGCVTWTTGQPGSRSFPDSSQVITLMRCADAVEATVIRFVSAFGRVDRLRDTRHPPGAETSRQAD